MTRLSLRPRAASLTLVSALLLGCAGNTTIVESALPQGISASGHGEARGQPDIASVTLGVETRSTSAEEATAQATQQMNAVLRALEGKGVAADDIRTQSFSINFEQQPEPYPPPRPLLRERVDEGAGSREAPAAKAAPEGPRGFYRVNHAMLVTVRQTAELGAILGAATTAGANNVWGIEFDIEDPSQLEATARAQAMERAKARAEHLAKLAGVKLGRVVSVGEASGRSPIAREGFGYSMKSVQMDVPVQSGDLTVGADVQVLFSIEH